MSTNYTPQTWRNEGEPGDDTPIDKDRLAHIEAGLAAHDHENGLAFGTDEPTPYQFVTSDATTEDSYYGLGAAAHSLLTFTATATGPITMQPPPNNGSAQLDFVLFKTADLPDPTSAVNSGALDVLDVHSTPSSADARSGFLTAGQSYTLVVVDWSGDDIATIIARPPVDVTPAIRALEPFGVNTHVPPATGTSGLIVAGPGTATARLAVPADVLPLVPGAPYSLDRATNFSLYANVDGSILADAGVDPNTIHLDAVEVAAPGSTLDVVPGYVQVYNYDPGTGPPVRGHTALRTTKTILVRATMSLSVVRPGPVSLVGEVHQFLLSAYGLGQVPILSKGSQVGTFDIAIPPFWLTVTPNDWGPGIFDLGLLLTLPGMSVTNAYLSWDIYPTA